MPIAGKFAPFSTIILLTFEYFKKRTIGITTNCYSNVFISYLFKITLKKFLIITILFYKFCKIDVIHP